MTFYLVSYDIKDEKRLRNVHRIMREFGVRLHYSVFRCDLTKQGKMILISKLEEVINHDADRIMIVDLGPSRQYDEMKIEFIGQKPEENYVNSIIV